jgi:hypothetical protein
MPKLIGLEIMALIVILGLYFAINRKWRLYDGLHFLGRARTLVVLVPATLLSVPFGMLTIYKGLGGLAVYFLLLWILTTEVVVRGAIALVAAIIAGAITHFICKKIYPENSLVTVGIPGLLGFITMIGTYIGVAKSSWLGERCPHCTTRGTVDTEQIGKDFLGTTSETSNLYGDNRLVFYNKYLITEQHTCRSCGQVWRSTRETKERS